jgi:hypothetical protein
VKSRRRSRKEQLNESHLVDLLTKTSFPKCFPAERERGGSK